MLEYLFNKFAGLVFSSEYWEIFKNSFFIDQLRLLFLNFLTQPIQDQWLTFIKANESFTTQRFG